jgi:hypothetical protein
VPNTLFAWSNLPNDLLKALVGVLQLDSSETEEALGKEYGTPPTEDLVLGALDVLRERWLAQDMEALAGVVQDLWQPSRDGYRPPATAQDKLVWLRGRRNTLRLREEVLGRLVALGERTTTVPSSLALDELAEGGVARRDK